MKQLHAANKRVACDRCRDQKLRCPRIDEDPEPCTRCQRAGAVCVTSSTRPLGRPSVDRSASGAAARIRRIRDRASERERERDRDRDQQDSALSLPLPPPPPRMPASVSSLMTPNTQPMWLMGGDENPTSDLLGSPHPARRSPADQRSVDAWASADVVSPLFGVKLPDEFMLFPFGGGSYDRFPTSEPDAALQLQAGRLSAGDGLGDVGLAAGPSARAASDQVEDDVGDGEEVVCDARFMAPPQTADALVALSRLNESITRHLSGLDSFQWQPPSVIGICAERVNNTAGNPVAQVMQSTNDFLTILKRLLSTLPASPAPQSEVSALDSAISLNDGSRASSLFAPSPLPPGSKSGSPGQPPHIRIGMPTLLLLLCNYLQLLQLYNNIFRHVQRALGEMTDEAFCSFQTQAQQRQPRQPSPLRVGGLEVSQGQLYVKVLVQVMEHQLESVQRLMGLPAEYRLSRRPGRATSNGIFSRLESSSCSDLLRAAMGSDAGPGEDMGQALAASLRESIEQVRDALQG